MNLGLKIKERRTLLQLTQEELANRCELTKGYISQIENDKVSPSIETLGLILEVLGTTFSEFFQEKTDSNYIFTASEQYDKEFIGYLQSWLVPTSQDHAMEPIYVELEVGGETFHDYPHNGEEFGYVIEGEISVVYGENEKICRAGESFYFTSNKEHYIKNRSSSRSKVIWVSCPPNF